MKTPLSEANKKSDKDRDEDKEERVKRRLRADLVLQRHHDLVYLVV
jgi:hypothetical protein